MLGSRLKVSLIVGPLAIVLVVVTYIYSLWSVDRQKANDLPVEAVSMMMRDILRFHETRGGFPEDLRKMEGAIWEQKTRLYSIKNRALSHRNYYYFYTRISDHQFTLWAIPIGKSREEAPTWFIVVTPNFCHRWKGAALPLDQVKRIEPNPSLKTLGVLGLIEQSTVDFNKVQKASGS